MTITAKKTGHCHRIREVCRVPPIFTARRARGHGCMGDDANIAQCFYYSTHTESIQLGALTQSGLAHFPATPPFGVERCLPRSTPGEYIPRLTQLLVLE